MPDCRCRCCAQLQAIVDKEAPSREDYVEAIEALSCAERVVVTGEALSQRLLGRHHLVDRLLQSCIDDSSSHLQEERPAAGLCMPSSLKEAQPWMTITLVA